MIICAWLQVLAKGQFLEKVVALLSRRELQRGKWQLTMQTSAVEATVHLSGNVACSRVDLLIAGTNPNLGQELSFIQ